MKKLFLLLALSLLLLAGCGKKKDYLPRFTVGERYTLADETITGRIIGEEYISLFSVFETEEDFIILGEETADEPFLTRGIIPLREGQNRLVIRFYREDAEKEYELLIEYIPITDITATLIDPARTYHIGEAFDRESIRVLAQSTDGTTVEVSDYLVEYAFSELGESDVYITVGDHYDTITVLVTEEYRPTLDDNLSANGIRYALKKDEAILLSGADASGFFAVPKTVMYEEKEYPVTSIADGAFEGAAVTEVLIPEGVRELGIGAFTACPSLEKVTLPESLVTIGRQAFADCASLSFIELPDALHTLEYGLFENCTSLSRVRFPASLETIGERAFSGCTALSRLDLPQSVSVIEKEAFADCDALCRVVLHDLKRLGPRAFADCENLTDFALSESTMLGADPFGDATPTIYTTEKSPLFSLASEAGLSVHLVTEAPLIVDLPTELNIADGYPYSEVFALILTENGISSLKDYEVSYPEDACGVLTATLTWGDFTHEFPVFVRYEERLTGEIDTRGVSYALDPIEKTATLLPLPEYVRLGKVYRPAQKGLFLVPTHLSADGEEYTVLPPEGDILSGCLNVESVFIPVLTE